MADVGAPAVRQADGKDGDDQVETDDADPVAGPRDPGEVGIALEVETPRPKMTKALSERTSYTRRSVVTNEFRVNMVNVHADFHKVDKVVEPRFGGWRDQVHYVLESHRMVNLMTLTILVDAICALIATDARAMHVHPPLYIDFLSEACLGVYTLELVAIFALHGKKALESRAVLFDIFTISCSYLDCIFQLFDAFGHTLPHEFLFLRDLRLLRVIRVMRVARIIQRMQSLKELRKLVSMMATCMKTLGWSFAFCFAFMTFWAMMLVEFVHPLLVQMQQDKILDCPDCVKSTSSIMDANLLLFKTVIAGDAWGRVAVPVIEYVPLTAIVFCGSLMTTVFGVLNMVIAVVVDSFAETRQKDVLNLAQELEYEHEKDKKRVENMFNRLDVEDKGDLTLQDLVKGAQTDPEFQSRLRVMDIDQADLQQLFEMIDADGSGAISKEEFIRPLTRWIHESKTAPRFVKYNVDRSLQAQARWPPLALFLNHHLDSVKRS
ncbi:unnamed protein product [Durusdinium trenchii]|uniref:EF-hand domain-containing protein n=1 Tax=Durusdinium trenchii TaxID=1381693 RepID=A0ABP0IVR4_9DINO